MDNPLIIVVAVVVIGFIVGGVVLRRLRAKKIEGFGKERGWGYEAVNDLVLDAYPQVFPFYSPGRSTSRSGIHIGGSSRTDSAVNVLRFMAGDLPGESFTYTYSTNDSDSEGTSTQNHYWHVVGLELPVPFPNLTIRKRRKLDALENRLTKPIEVPHPGLSEVYTIHGEHAPAAFDLITPDMAQWLLAEGFKNELVVQDTRLFVYAKGKQKVENIDSMIAQLTGFTSRIPAEAWRKAQGEYPRPERTLMVDHFDLNAMKDAYQQWRDSK